MAVPSDKVHYVLYLSRLLSSWGDRSWSFLSALFMLLLQPNSLQLVAVYGLASSVAVLVFCAWIGHLVDRTGRLKAATVALLVQNSCVVLTCAVITVFLLMRDYTDISSWQPVFICLAMLFSIIAGLASIATRISMEKDWIVVLYGNDSSHLATVNANVRTIDQVCQLCGPLLVGQLLFFSTYLTTALIVAGWNILSGIVELLLLRLIYSSCEDLQKPKVILEAKQQKKQGIAMAFSSTWQGWVTYMKHPVRNAGLGLAFLYMTVLGFDSITWSYCLLQGVSESTLGLLTGLSAVMGVAGARIFPIARKRLGLEKTGCLGFVWLTSCLLFCVASVWAPGSPFDPTNSYATAQADSDLDLAETDALETQNGTKAEAHISLDPSEEEGEGESKIAVSLLLVGIISFRLGLWVADLSVQQILQERVVAHCRGSLSGVQSSLQSALDLVKFCLVVALPHPRFFGILILLSFTFVSSGALFFFSFAWTSLRRGLPKERNESSEKEKKVKEEEEEEGHINASLVLDETADQVSKLSGDIHGDSRGT